MTRFFATHGKCCTTNSGMTSRALKESTTRAAAALLHDVGTHLLARSEELFPDQETARKYVHEQYSAAIVRGPLRSAIEEHKLNQGYNLSADDVAALLEGSAGARQGIFARSDHGPNGCGSNGLSLARLAPRRRSLWSLRSATADIDDDGNSSQGRATQDWNPGGRLHAAEALVIARYFMFTQVYFHKTRVAYHIHIREAMKELLPDGHFPKPASRRVSGMGRLACSGTARFGRADMASVCLDVIITGWYSRRTRSRLLATARLAKVRESLGGLLAAEMPAERAGTNRGHGYQG